MTSTTASTIDTILGTTSRSVPPRPIPLARIVGVEVRKSFDTRSGFWLLAGIGIAALLTSGAVIAWAPASQLAHSEFCLAIGVPMTVILPIIAVAVGNRRMEPAQRVDNVHACASSWARAAGQGRWRRYWSA